MKVIKTYELSVLVAKYAGTKQEDTWEAIDNILAIIKERWIAGEEVNLRGYGRFTYKLYPHKNAWSGILMKHYIREAHYKPIFWHSEALFGIENSFKPRKPHKY